MTITDVAKKVGVATKTLIRWERAGKISPAKRDWRGWRVYRGKDLEELSRMRNHTYYV